MGTLNGPNNVDQEESLKSIVVLSYEGQFKSTIFRNNEEVREL